MGTRPTGTNTGTPYTYVLTGKGSTAVDQEYSDILTAIQGTANNRGTLWIKGEVTLNASHHHGDTRMDLVGFERNASRINLGPGAQLTWQATGMVDPYANLSWTSMDPYSGRDDIVVSSGLNGSPGQWFCTRADDVILGMPWHTSVLRPLPLELHQIKDVSGSSYVFSDFLSDICMTNPRVALAPLMGGIRIADLQINNTAAAGSEATRSFIITGVNGLRMENVEFGPIAPAGVQLEQCSNARITGCNFGNSISSIAGHGYGILCNGGNGILIDDNHFWTWRHPVSTGSSSSGVDFRAGTVRGLVVKDNRFHGATKAFFNTDGLVMLDTHAEGFGTTYDGNVCTLPFEGIVATGFNARARNTRYLNNLFVGRTNLQSSTQSVRLGTFWADGGVFQGNTVEGMWIGVTVNQLSGSSAHTPAGIAITHNLFKDFSGAPVFLQYGHDVRVAFNQFQNVGHDSQSTQKCCISIIPTVSTGVQNVKVRHNTLDLDTNDKSIWCDSNPSNVFDFGANSAFGYGPGLMGLGGAYGNTLESTQAVKNWTD